MPLKTRLLLFCFLALPSMVIGTSQISAQDAQELVDSSERDAILSFLITKTQLNWEKVKTWEGEYSFQDKIRMTPKMLNDMFGSERQEVDRGDVMRLEQGTIQFALDVKADLLYTCFQLQHRSLKETEGEFQEVALPNDESLFFQKSIITSEDYVSFEPNVLFTHLNDLPTLEIRPTAVAIRDAVSKSKGLQDSVVVDPRYFFGTNDRTFCWGDLQTCVNNGANAEIWRIQSEEGLQYRVDLVAQLGNSQSQLVGSYTFAEKYNFNLVSFSFGFVGSTPKKKISWEYIQEDGIYIPSHIRNVAISDDGRLIKFERILKLKNIVLNKDVDAGKFTYAGIGLKDGDRIVDRIECVGLVMRNERPHKFAKFGEKLAKSSDETNPTMLRLVVILGGLCIIIVSIVLKIRNYSHV